MVIYNKTAHSSSLQTSVYLKVNGDILTGVFLAFSSFVVPGSSYSSNAESNSLSVAWLSNCSSAASCSKSTITSFFFFFSFFFFLFVYFFFFIKPNRTPIGKIVVTGVQVVTASQVQSIGCRWQATSSYS